MTFTIFYYKNIAKRSFGIFGQEFIEKYSAVVESVPNPLGFIGLNTGIWIIRFLNYDLMLFILRILYI